MSYFPVSGSERHCLSAHHSIADQTLSNLRRKSDTINMHIFLFLCFGFLGVSLATPGSPNSTPLNAVPSSSNTFITLTSQSTKTPPVSYVTTTSKVPSTVSSIIPSKTAVPDCNYQVRNSRLLEELREMLKLYKGTSKHPSARTRHRCIVHIHNSSLPDRM